MRKAVVKGNMATFAGEAYRATVLRVVESDTDGTPRVFRLLRDDEVVDIAGETERTGKPPSFEIVYARTDLQTRRH